MPGKKEAAEMGNTATLTPLTLLLATLLAALKTAVSTSWTKRRRRVRHEGDR